MAGVIGRSILAATDLSDASDEVLRAAAALAARTGAALHVIHVFHFPPTPYLEQYPTVLAYQERMAAAAARVDAQLARVVPPEVPVASRKLAIDTPHRAIAAYAAAVGAGLIVLGPHARRPVEAPFLGTTADRVIRTVPVPCLIVRGPLHLPLRRVVVPIDLSEPARGALDMGLRWAAGLGGSGAGSCLPLPGTEVSIVHVIPQLFAPGGLPFERATVLPGVNREVEEALARVDGRSELEVREELLWGERADEEIVSFARGAEADMVVLATHGYGALGRALIGGTASSVARTAPCPVLLVPPRAWRAAPAPGLTESEVEGQLPAMALG